MNKMRKGDETKDWITTVEHGPADRQADGRWEGTIIQKKAQWERDKMVRTLWQE